MKEIEAAFIELKKENVRETLWLLEVWKSLQSRLWKQLKQSQRPSLFQKCRLSYKQKHVIKLTQYQKHVMEDGETYDVFSVPFTFNELACMSAEMIADALHQIAVCSGYAYFYMNRELYGKLLTHQKQMTIHWVSRNIVAMLRNGSLAAVCSEKLNIRQQDLKVLLFDEEEDSFEKQEILKWVLYSLCHSVNHLCILTEHEDSYTNVVEHIYESEGLPIEILQKIPADFHLLIDISEMTPLKYHKFPQNSMYVSLFADAEKERLLSVKRRDIITLT